MQTTHGIPEEYVDEAFARLEIASHTPEDCQLSETLHSASGKPVVVEGPAVWVFEEDAIVRYRISAGARRRILAGNTGEVELTGW